MALHQVYSSPFIKGDTGGFPSEYGNMKYFNKQKPCCFLKTNSASPPAWFNIKQLSLKQIQKVAKYQRICFLFLPERTEAE
jgi:hypothetical protein